MSCEQSIYRIRFALEDRLSVELVFGEKFVSQDSMVFLTLALIKAKPHVREVAITTS